MRVRGHWPTRRVWVDEKLLDLEASLKIKKICPVTFSWGYPNTGAAQLAISLLDLYLGPELAIKYELKFRKEVLGRIPQASFDYKDDRWITDWMKKNIPEFTTDVPVAPPVAA